MRKSINFSPFEILYGVKPILFCSSKLIFQHTQAHPLLCLVTLINRIVSDRSIIMILRKSQLEADRSTAAKNIHEAQKKQGVLLHDWSESDEREHAKENQKGRQILERVNRSLHRI